MQSQPFEFRTIWIPDNLKVYIQTNPVFRWTISGWWLLGELCKSDLFWFFFQIDPRSDPSWATLANSIETDGVHARDRVGPGQNNRGLLYKLGRLCKCDTLGLLLKSTHRCNKKFNKIEFFGQVSTRTGCYQLPIFRCTNVHPVRYAHPLFRSAVFI